MGMATGTDEAHDAEAVADLGGQRHKPEYGILRLFCFMCKYHNYDNAYYCKRYIAEYAEQKRLTVCKPLILRKHTKGDAQYGQCPHCDGKLFTIFDFIAFTPNVE